MYADDQPRAAMTFVVEFDFSGEVEKGHFQAAYDKALLRHPLLRSIIRKAKANRDCWVAPDGYDSQIVWLGNDDSIYISGAGYELDLTRQVGIKTWGSVGNGKSRFTFVFHHACCDGIGAYQFVGDCLWYYAELMGEELEPLIELDETDLKARMRVTTTPELLGFHQREQLGPPQKPSCPVAQVDGEAGKTDRNYPNFFTYTYEKDAYRELRLRAQNLGQTVNDLLLESMFVAILRWNRKHGIEAADGAVTINMPLDLREPGQPNFSAVNLVTSGFLQRSVEEIENREALEQSIREECTLLKHTRFESELMKFLFGISGDVHEAAQAFRGNDCLSTVVFSNTGDPTKRFLAKLPRRGGKVCAANLVLEDINGVSPLRYQTRASFSLFTYQRRLRICMRTDAEFLSDAASQAFLDNFVECIDNPSPEPL